MKIRESKSKLKFWRFENIAKFLLAIIAACSFTLAFYYDSIIKLKLIFYPMVDKKCLKNFYKNIPPYMHKESLTKSSYALCFDNFNIMYSGVSKTPLWVVEALSPNDLKQDVVQEYKFYEEKKIPLRYRASVNDYSFSEYYPWPMVPNKDMLSTKAQHDIFSLANAVPVTPYVGTDILRDIEDIIRGIVVKYDTHVYIVSGPLFETQRLKLIGQNSLLVPTSIYKAIYIPKTGMIGAYYVSNDKSGSVSVVSVCYIEEKSGINLFPQLMENEKRNTYDLPLEVSRSIADEEIEYSFWDGESSCAEEVSDAKINDLQKRFKYNKAEI